MWDDGSGFADVGFWSDGSLVFYARDADGKEIRDDLSSFDELPGALLNILRSFAS